MLKSMIQMLSTIQKSSNLKTGRSFLDVFQDRLRQASNEPTLLLATERLIQLLDVQVHEINTTYFQKFLKVCVCPQAGQILIWLRQNSNLATMLASGKDIPDDIYSAIVLPPEETSGVVASAPKYDICISVECLSPLAHGGDVKAGNATLFRRRQVIGTTGELLSLPFYSGNAVRGVIRDLLADHLIQSLGLSKESVNLWFFHAVYAGGALEESSNATASVEKLLGKNGLINSDGFRRFRDMLPSLSALGVAMGNRILSGRCQVADLRPHCQGWGNGDHQVSDLFCWEFLTRREDNESHEENHSMIANTECLRAGTLLSGGVDFDGHASDMEKSAIATGLKLLQSKGYLGAESRRGLGSAAITFENLPKTDLYLDFVKKNSKEIHSFLLEIGAINV